MVWVTGYEGVMGFEAKIPANQLGRPKILWVMREYGLTGLWVKRESTVILCRKKGSRGKQVLIIPVIC